MKKIKMTVVVVVVLALILTVGKNLVVKAAVEQGVQFATGLKLRMDGLDLNLMKTSLGIHGMKLYNPRGFQEKFMVQMPEIYVDYHLSDILSGTIHLEEVRIHLEEFLVEKNKDGALNLNSLKPVEQQKEAAQKPARDEQKPAAKEEKRPTGFQIDRLIFRVDKVVYKDYSRGGEPSVREFPLQLNEQYENITNPAYLVSVIVVKIMMRTPLAALTNFDLAGLQQNVSDILASSTELAEQAVAKVHQATAEAQEKLKATSEELQKALSAKTPEQLKEAASALTGTARDLTSGFKSTAADFKDKIKLPFAKQE